LQAQFAYEAREVAAGLLLNRDFGTLPGLLPPVIKDRSVNNEMYTGGFGLVERLARQLQEMQVMRFHLEVCIDEAPP
jgi:hypothetical protein